MSENDSQLSNDVRAHWVEKLKSVASSTDVIKFLDSLRESEIGQESELYLELSQYALAHASSVTRSSLADAKSLIFKYLLPLCVEEHDGNPYEKGKLRKLLRKWVEQYPQHEMSKLRTEIHSQIFGALETEPSENLLWLISTLGYRTDDLVRLLHRIVRSDSELAESAMGVLVGLGVTQANHDEIYNWLERKIRDGSNSNTVSIAVQELVGPERTYLAAELLENFRHDTSEADHHFQFSAIASVATRAITRSPHELEVHERCWRVLAKYKRDVQMMPDLASRCNTEKALIDMTCWLVEEEENEIVWYRLLSAIDKMTAPNQLKAWDSINRKELVKFLKPIATKDTKSDGRFVTTGLRLKRSAWEAALCANCDVSDWIENAVVNETGASIVHDISNIIACANVQTLPATILQIITEPREENEAENDRFYRETGAIGLASSCTDWDSFTALLDFQHTHNGSVLVSTLDAITAAAVTQLETRREDLLGVLHQKVGPDNPPHQREAAIAVLCDFCRSRFISPEEVESLWVFAFDDSLCENARKDAISVIADSDATISEEQSQQILSLAINDESEMGWRATEVVIKRGLAAIDDSWLVARLGLDNRGEIMCVLPKKATGWQAHLISMLYEKFSEKYANPVAAIIKDAAIDVVYQLLGALRRVGFGATSKVLAAFVQRIRTSNSRSIAETEFFHVLGAIAPSRLLAIAEDDEARHWLVEARVALCEALRNLTSNKESNLVPVLMRFATDPAFQVRRSAFRAIAEIAPERLLQVVFTWAGDSNNELRKRAAEAMAWLPSKSMENLDVLRWDRERVVREVFSLSQKMKRKRELANEYMEIVRENCNSRDRDMRWYRYARALTHVGDDDTARMLYELSKIWQLPANVKHCLRKTIKELKANWKQVTEKWPEPWTHETGMIEQFDGLIELRDGKKVAAKFSLWCKFRASQSELSEWGGVAEDIHASTFSFFDLGKIKIHLPDRKVFTADIYRSHSDNRGATRIVFRSNEPYPTKKSDPDKSYLSLSDLVINLVNEASIEVPESRRNEFETVIQTSLDVADVELFGTGDKLDKLLSRKLLTQQVVEISSSLIDFFPDSPQVDFFLWQLASDAYERQEMELRLTSRELKSYVAKLRSAQEEDDLIFWLIERVEFQSTANTTVWEQ